MPCAVQVLPHVRVVLVFAAVDVHTLTVAATADNYCSTLPCGINARCSDLYLVTYRSCQCNVGYSGDPDDYCAGMYALCVLFSLLADTNACITTPCGGLYVHLLVCLSCPGNTTCTDQPAPSLTRTCTCLPGYAGTPTVNGSSGCIGCCSFRYFELNRSDINGCLTKTCPSQSRCVDQVCTSRCTVHLIP
jgi:hypothetical protein